MRFQAPKGMRDYYPELMAQRNWVMERWHRVSRRAGFEEFDGPIFEDLDLYRVKSGDEIVEQLFHFTDRGGREMAIRPEITPTLARMIAARAQSLKRPIRWYSVPRLCRAERPQRGRLREFFQWNIDILGEEGVEADAECVFVALDFFRELGLTPEHVLMKINSRSLVAAMLTAGGFDADRLDSVYAVLDKRDKLPEGAFCVELEKLNLGSSQRDLLLFLGALRNVSGQLVIAHQVGSDPEVKRHLSELQRMFELLSAMGVGEYCRFDMGVVRGLAYYTGPVFEAFGKGGLQRAIGGGGRYDGLVQKMGGPAMPAVGFASSDAVILDVLEEFGLMPKIPSGVQVFVANADPANPELEREVQRIVAELRRRGVATTYAYRCPALGKQFKQANDRNAARVLIVDGTTLAGEMVGLKDMATGAQASVPMQAALEDPMRPVEAQR